MIVIFDLDDTLYEELTYVKSGFQAVAGWVSENLNIDRSKAYDFFNKELKYSGRGHIFDVFLIHHEIYSKKNVSALLRIYRHHTPAIKLHRDVLGCFKRLEKIPLFLITDGHKIVQEKKIKKLQLNKYFKKIFITHRFGINHSKPSTYCFTYISMLEKMAPEKIFYIGDNPNKDFVGIKKLGYQTIRILRGNYKNIRLPKNFEAKIKIHSLSEISVSFLLKILKNEKMKNPIL